jgi:pimeloyl-ACP methyl ester carboxylesterase
MPDNRRTTKLRIPGSPIQGSAPEVPAEIKDQIKIKEVQAFQISISRAGAADSPIIESLADDIVEVELEDGVRFWTTQERLRTEVLGLAATRAADGVIELPATFERRGATRGFIGKVTIKVLKFFKIDVAKTAAHFIAEKLENHLLGSGEDGRGPGIYQIPTGTKLRLAPVSEAVVNLPADRPSLLFLHGTASSTAGSFGKLWTDKRQPQRQQLLAPYEGRVFGLEHETLSKSPVYNAIAAAERLPAKARLHLVSHSRGGMVGELLCRAGITGARDPFDASDLAFFREHNPDKARGDLEHLNDLLKEKRFRIERFVRVACPARGTTLASGRLDIYLSVLFNLLSKIPVLSSEPAVKIAFDIFSELIMAIAKERSDPSVLPGIEAMIPSSPLVALLNRVKEPVAGELRVIAGDIEGDNVLSAIGTLLTDPLYQDDHDLVVNTDAMFGGAERAEGAGFLFRRGPNVNHFSYFENADSAEGLARALSRTGSEGDGFEPFSVLSADSDMPPYEKRGMGDALPVVFVLPGIMGSHLAINDNRIWLDPFDIMGGKFGFLSYGTPNLVRAEAPISMFYGDLVKHLAKTHRVEPFPFDWRLSIFDEAKRLADAIVKALDDTEKSKQPVSIIAHSMGGLVARAMIADRPDVWNRLRDRAGGRLIMLGTPNGGSHVVTQTLTGRDSIIRKLSLIDVTRKQRELVGIVAQFPGLLEMLPTSSNFDLFDAGAWQNLVAADPERDTWQPPMSAALASAKTNRERLANSPIDPERMFYIAGLGPATPTDLAIEGSGKEKRLVFYATPKGDGRVPWETGIPKGVKTWYLKAAHGDLASEEDGFDAITDLLRRGATDLLSMTPPEVRGVPERFELTAEREPLYPDFADLARTAVGAGRVKKKRHMGRKIQVRLRHGNLAFASHPVLVGHYKGDTIISAEAYLDRTLDHRLSARHQVRLYPGDNDTAEVFLNMEWEASRKGDGKPPGAIVIGLGAVGELSPGQLMRAVSRGARSYALSRAGYPQIKSGEARLPGISALLVGTGAGGIAVQDAVNAILRGIIDANSVMDEPNRIAEVEFIEVYEDRAIQAARTLARLRSDPEISRAFAIDAEPVVLPLDGGMRRANFFEEDPWWQRLQIIERDDKLSFNLLTDRARAESYLQESQRTLADKFIEEMSASTSSNEGVAITLYEILVPNDLKEYAPERRDMVLLLNAAAARYPWEMMQERRRGDDEVEQAEKPIAVQAGLVRQLMVERFRDRVVMARGNRALVVGNPPTPFANLPGAEKEAQEVVRALKDVGYQPIPLIGAEAEGTTILRELFARDYQIIHLAGHGVYDFRPPVPCSSCGQPTDGEPISGMVIGENQFLTAGQIRQMRSVPQLVFVNCCHLGNINDRRPPRNLPPDLAANVAAELIKIGVRGVVAAGWAVQDDAAALFAATFYGEMLSGSAFGYAVHEARRATYDQCGQYNTWGAYQCYGDPTFVLGKGEATGAVRRRRISYAALSEAVVDLQNLVAEVKTEGNAAADSHLKRIREIEAGVPAQWSASGALQAALGEAYGEIRHFEEAVEHYRRAVEDDSGLATIKAAEQLWNLQSRWAQTLAGTDPARSVKLMSEAENGLLKLNTALGETVERLSLLASVAKRRMMISSIVSEKRAALYTMADYYRLAYDLGVERGKPAYYPLANYLTGQTLAFLLEEKGALPGDFDASLKEVMALAENEKQTKPDFWNTVTQTDCMVLRYLADRNISDHILEIIDGYGRVKNVGSPREFQSVLDQLDFLKQVIAAGPEGEVRRQLAGALEEIRKGMESAGSGG